MLTLFNPALDGRLYTKPWGRQLPVQQYRRTLKSNHVFVLKFMEMGVILANVDNLFVHKCINNLTAGTVPCRNYRAKSLRL